MYDSHNTSHVRGRCNWVPVSGNLCVTQKLRHAFVEYRMPSFANMRKSRFDSMSRNTGPFNVHRTRQIGRTPARTDYDMCWVIPFGGQAVMFGGACSASWVESHDVPHERGASESQGTQVIIIRPIDAGIWAPRCGDSLAAELW